MSRQSPQPVHFDDAHLATLILTKKTLSEEFQEAEENGRRLAQVDIRYSKQVETWINREQSAHLVEPDEPTFYISYLKNLQSGQHRVLPSICAIQ